MPQGLSGLLLPLLLLLLVGFMFWSQRRRQRAVQDVQSALSPGDEICTTSGLFGRVVEVDDTTMMLEVAPGTVVKLDKRAVAFTLPPTQLDTAAGRASDASDASDDGVSSPVVEK